MFRGMREVEWERRDGSNLAVSHLLGPRGCIPAAGYELPRDLLSGCAYFGYMYRCGLPLVVPCNELRSHALQELVVNYRIELSTIPV